MFPLVQAIPEAFCRFTASLVPAIPARYAADLAPVQARFTDLLVLERLPPRRHRPPAEAPLGRAGGRTMLK